MIGVGFLTLALVVGLSLLVAAVRDRAARRRARRPAPRMVVLSPRSATRLIEVVDATNHPRISEPVDTAGRWS